MVFFLGRMPKIFTKNLWDIKLMSILLFKSVYDKIKQR